MTELSLFEGAGEGLDPEHFGIADDGRAYVQAPAFARAMGYSRTSDALKMLDDDEKGTAICRTPGGNQQLSVIYEDGIWELIFRSTLPSARSLKTRVKAILRELRETGVVDTRPADKQLPQDYETALVHLLEQVRARKALEDKVQADAPKVEAWQAFIDRDGWLQVSDVARAIGWGRNKMFERLRELGVLLQRPKNAPCAEWVKKGWACARPNGHVNQRGEEETTTLISPEGAARIERLLNRDLDGVA
ncbi:phage antirepressor KilAC domain-containing protein [Amycolatopsis thermoflava]|uniref:phage antirepressor KilAC domain-containing protein n=1 Tax=Amycolatopsis thermoflava TaxID=84480 RepID=UPI000421786E|nr:phage antirepressor KilAC domain-containing protein [Amycolatopsis thermoflava]